MCVMHWAWAHIIGEILGAAYLYSSSSSVCRIRWTDLWVVCLYQLCTLKYLKYFILFPKLSYFPCEIIKMIIKWLSSTDIFCSEQSISPSNALNSTKAQEIFSHTGIRKWTTWSQFNWPHNILVNNLKSASFLKSLR